VVSALCDCRPGFGSASSRCRSRRCHSGGSAVEQRGLRLAVAHNTGPLARHRKRSLRPRNLADWVPRYSEVTYDPRDRLTCDERLAPPQSSPRSAYSTTFFVQKQARATAPIERNFARPRTRGSKIASRTFHQRDALGLVSPLTTDPRFRRARSSRRITRCAWSSGKLANPKRSPPGQGRP
jgi:hypothetical protein